MLNICKTIKYGTQAHHIGVTENICPRGIAGIILHRNRRLTKVKLKSSLLSNKVPVSTSKCKSRRGADFICDLI